MQAEAVQVLQRLLRFDTVNPPGAERAAQEYLAGLLRDAGLEVTLAGPDPERPNLVARLRGRAPGPVLGLLSHVDTVGADPEGWRHDPWSGALDDGCVWGRGALDMKSQTAAEVVAVTTLARAGWRPASGDLLVISAADEEVEGTGAIWLCEHARELVRCDYLLNEGEGPRVDVGDERFYGVSLGEKGVFRFTLHTDGVAGHASLPASATTRCSSSPRCWSAWARGSRPGTSRPRPPRSSRPAAARRRRPRGGAGRARGRGRPRSPRSWSRRCA